MKVDQIVYKRRIIQILCSYYQDTKNFVSERHTETHIDQ